MNHLRRRHGRAGKVFQRLVMLCLFLIRLCNTGLVGGKDNWILQPILYIVFELQHRKDGLFRLVAMQLEEGNVLTFALALMLDLRVGLFSFSGATGASVVIIGGHLGQDPGRGIPGLPRGWRLYLCLGMLDGFNPRNPINAYILLRHASV